MSLYFIRHGESQANKEGFLAGQLDVPITKEGITQATLAGKNLRASGITIDEIVSSPLRRAYDTAVIIAEAIHYPVDRIALNPKLIERNMGFLQGKPVGSVHLLDSMSEYEQESAGVETEAMLQVRAKELLGELGPLAGKNILLVGHNGFTRRLLRVIHGVDLHKTRKFPNAQVVDLADTSLLEN